MLRGGFGSRRCVVSAVSVNTRSKEKQLAYCAELSTSLRSLMHSSFDLIDGAHRLRRLSNVLNCFDYPKVFMRVIPLRGPARLLPSLRRSPWDLAAEALSGLSYDLVARQPRELLLACAMFALPTFWPRMMSRIQTRSASSSSGAASA